MVVRGKPLGRSQQVGGGEDSHQRGPLEASFRPVTLPYRVLDNRNLEELAWCCGGEDLEAHPHDVQTYRSHYRHICVHVCRVDDFGHVDFLPDGQSWPGAVQEHYKLAHSVALESSNLGADFQIDYRKKGLLWFSTYKVAFDGTYTFKNPTGQDRVFTIRLPLPAKQAVYDNLQLALDGTPLSLSYGGAEVSATGRVAANGTGTLKAGYRSQGLDTWSYQFANGEEVARINDFHLLMKTNFGGFDFPENTLSPTEKHETAQGWDLKWDYQNLVSGFNVSLKMPQKLQPGPLAGKISYFAPVSLFFFFFLIFILSALRGIDLHPMNYFFLAAAFFAFHLLLAYLCDHALIDAGLSQLIYLVLFSYAFFFEGFTGLAVTIGAILTLFVVMQMTGRIKWAEKFAKQPA